MSERMDASIDAVLAQMRQMRMSAQGGLQQQDIVPLRTQEQRGEFTRVLTDAISAVNENQVKAGAMANAYVSGESTDLVGTMIASQKASVGFQGLMAVRNRMVSAYQDIMNMPI